MIRIGKHEKKIENIKDKQQRQTKRVSFFLDFRNIIMEKEKTGFNIAIEITRMLLNNKTLI